MLDANDNNSSIDEINAPKAEQLKKDGVITGGMIPKIDNALNAARGGVQEIIIGHAAFIKQMAAGQKGYGTHISI